MDEPPFCALSLLIISKFFPSSAIQAFENARGGEMLDNLYLRYELFSPSRELPLVDRCWESLNLLQHARTPCEECRFPMGFSST